MDIKKQSTTPIDTSIKSDESKPLQNANDVSLDTSVGTTGEQLRFLRKKAGLTQDGFAVAFSNFLGRKSEYRRTTIGGWENNSPPPPRKILRKIAEFYGVPYDILSKDVRPVVIDMSDAKRINSDTLWQIDNEPVWCLFTHTESGLSVYGKWGIVDATAGEIVFSKTHSIPFSKADFEMYKRPLPFSFPPDAMGRALTKREVELRNQIWIEPIGGEYQTRQLLKSWGSYNKQQDSVVCENGMIYPMRLYAKTFLAYSDPCDYKPQKIK